MIATTAAAALLCLAQDAVEAVEEYWRFLGPVGLYGGRLAEALPKTFEPGADEAFAEAHTALVRSMAGAGVDGALLRAGLIDGDAGALRRIAECGSPELAAAALASFDLPAALATAKRCSAEFRTVAGTIARATLGLFYENMTRGQLVERRLDEAVAAVAAEPDYVAAYLRMASDRVFLTHMADPRARGPRAAEVEPDPSNAALLAIRAKPPGDPVTWAAYIRWNVSEDRGNFYVLDEAIEADPDNAYAMYLRGYFYLFSGDRERGWRCVDRGNAAPRYEPRSREILEALSSVRLAPFRRYMAVYSAKFPHVRWIGDLALTYADMQVGELLEAGRTDEAWAVLDRAHGAVRRARDGAVLAAERAALGTAIRAGLVKKARALLAVQARDEFVELQRRIDPLDRERAAAATAMPATCEFEFLAAGLLLEPDAAEAHWRRRADAGFDRALIDAAAKRYEAEIAGKLLAERPELFGEPVEGAAEAFREGRQFDAVVECARALEVDPLNLHAIELRHRALKALGD